MKRFLRLPRSRPVRVVLLACGCVLAFLLGPYVFSRVLSPLNALQLEEVASVKASPKTPIDDGPSQRGLRVVCYNIAHGRGLAASNTDGGTQAERKYRLDEIVGLLRRIDAGVVVLNEADFDASWSGSVNQAAYLAEQAGYRYYATLRNLDFSVGPWRWDFGNAVLSRYPITDAYEIDQPGYAAWETILAGKKRSLFCEIDVDGQAVGVVAVHLSHRSEALRVASARNLLAFAESYGQPLILAGDFNATPSGYPGSKTDAQQYNAMDVLGASGLFSRVPNALAEDGAAYTFRSDNPSRIIDWVLASQGLQIVADAVEPSLLSDHRPVVADLIFEE